MLKETTQGKKLFGSKPNILFILSDDHGYGDFSFYQKDPSVQTPNLDRIRKSGILFEQGFVSAPICSPSRSSMMVGSHQQRWGGKWFDSSNFAPAPYQSIPEILKEADYRSGYFGKIHYGPDTPGSRSCPEKHGFDESFYGLAAQGMGRLHYMIHEKEAETKHGEAANIMGMHAMYENGEAIECHEHLTIEFGQRTRSFIEKAVAEEEPYFCMLAFNAVHNFTWQLPEEELERHDLPAYDDFNPQTAEYLDWYDGAISPNLPNGRAYYLAQLELMDREIGKVLDTLEATGTMENTLVVYLTDNGGSACNYGDNYPLSGSKYSLFEGGVRVPYLVSWPTVIAPESQTENLASSMDLLPTFAYLAGVELPSNQPIDGVNLVPSFLGENHAGHEALYFDTGFQWSVRTKDWKLHEVNSDEQAQNARRSMQEVEHTDIGQGKSLFHLKENISEAPALDCSTSHPEKVEELTNLFQEWQKRIQS